MRPDAQPDAQPGARRDALAGGFADPARTSARAFRAAMEAMARPGRIYHVEGGTPPAPLSIGCGTLILTLCDRSTPLHLAGAADNLDVRSWVAFHTGSPLVAAEAAAFAVGAWDALLPLDRFPPGTPDYPDRSATLIVEVAALANEGARLTGPGIETDAFLLLPDPLAPLLANSARYPLGVDLFLAADNRIAALPRSTRIG